MTVTIKILDMSCDHCKMTIEKVLKVISGVEDVQVDLTDKNVQVSGKIEVNKVVDAIRTAGYTAGEIQSIKL
jgi:copper chaperone